jgi:two-component system, NtrC family, response regulator AtoC
MQTILVAEDEADIRNYLKLALGCYGFNVDFAENGDEVVSSLLKKHGSYDLLLLDIFMPCQDGLETLKEVRRLYPELPVIMMSVASSPGNVVAAMGNGANSFLAKPISHEDLRKEIERVLGAQLPRKQASNAQNGTSEAEQDYVTFTGTWSRKIALLLDRVGSSDVPVLLQGETGVGKEVIARKLHARSRRANRPFLKLNCAALPSELVESELFGYEKGAFTGAFKNTPGKFEMANGGTILLDEIGDMDFRLQAKLLQVIQDREFLRLGAKETSRVDVRIMAASHCDFEKAIQEGRFREDLYYRLNIIDIRIPPLRERRDEIIPLAEFFLHKYVSPDSSSVEITPSLRRALIEHSWPGNVRELENVIQKYLVLRNPTFLVEEILRRARRTGGTTFLEGATSRKNTDAAPVSELAASAYSGTADLCPSEFTHSDDTAQDTRAWANGTSSSGERLLQHGPSQQSPHSSAESILSRVEEARKAAEAEAIVAALQSTLWNRKQAASMLNIDYKALLYKMKKLGIGEKRMAG